MIAPPCSGVGKTTLPPAPGRRFSGAIERGELPAPTRCVLFSALKKKNSLSRTMRPPVLAPYCATMFFGLAGVVWKTLRALSVASVS